MPKFKKVIRRQTGGRTPEQVPAWLRSIFEPGIAGTAAFNKAVEGLKQSWNQSGNLKSDYGSGYSVPAQSPQITAGVAPVDTRPSSQIAPSALPKVGAPLGRTRVRSAPMPAKRASVPVYLDRDMGAISGMLQSQPELMKAAALGVPGLPAAEVEGEGAELASMMAASGKGSPIAEGSIPKTKAGMKKFMQEYGKFIALGAMAGAGGKGGQIAAPIMAALPGLIEMMKGRGKDKVNKKADGGKLFDALESAYAEFDKDKYSKGKLKTGAKRDEEMRSVAKERMERFSPKSPSTMVQYNPQQGSWYTPSGFREFEDYGERKRKSDESEKKSGSSKKSEGGAIRKFKGGSMNTKDSMFTPKYKKGGDMPKGKAAGEMPQHKKMAMGKPTPQSTGQKFAKGGTAKYAGGGMCKGYGISKKIRPTGPMN